MKWISAVFVTFALCIISLRGQAQITGPSVADEGVSAEDTIENVNVIYGGLANGMLGENNGFTTENSCNFSTAETFAGNVLACNNRNIGNSVNVVISFTYAGVKSGSSFKAKFAGESDFDGGDFSPAQPATSGTATYTVNWGALCLGKLNGSCTATNVAKSFSENLEIRITDGATDTPATGFSLTYLIKYRNSAATNSVISVNCPDGGDEPTGAICDFEVYPGDSKVYFKKLEDKNNSLLFGSACAPDDPVSGEKWYGVRVYAKKYTGAIDVSPANYEIVEDLTFPVNYECADFNPGDEFALEGLENGVEYQFSVATLDPTGTVEGYFRPSTTLNAMGTKVRATPAPVEGLLENKCFIATAAFGSPLAPQVEVLRNYRDQWLLKSAAGKLFVKNYYKYSPKLAEWISERPVMKSLVRGFLWPLILFAQLTLEFGWMFLISLFALSASLLFYFKLKRQAV